MKPQKDRKYLAYIRSLACAVCSVTTGIDAHHFGPRGMGQKSSDLQTLPLCRRHHKLYHELGPRKFAQRYSLDIPAIIKRLQAKPKLSIEDGSFIARIENQEYVLGSTAMGWEKALAKVGQLWWEDRKLAS